MADLRGFSCVPVLNLRFMSCSAVLSEGVNPSNCFLSEMRRVPALYGRGRLDADGLEPVRWTLAFNEFDFNEFDLRIFFRFDLEESSLKTVSECTR